MASNSTADGLYPYQPSHALPAVFSVIVGLSLLLHVYQNFRYGFWRVTFFMFYGGLIFAVGWVARCVSSYHPANMNLYIVQTVFIYAGPPIYSAAEYNVLGRLMRYVPMLAPLNPDRVKYFFIYLGVAVEGLTSAGASQYATADGDLDQYRRGGLLISAALALQGAVELVFLATVAMMHRRCARHKLLTPNLRVLCLMLYGTSTLVLLRCVARAIQSFSEALSYSSCNGLCRALLQHEWYLYVFEAAPMVLYTLWINLIHPGRLLPRDRNRYLDMDGKTERMGPGWIDRRSKWETFMDPLGIMRSRKGELNHEEFWLDPDRWQIAPGGSFAEGTATNVSGTFWPRARGRETSKPMPGKQGQLNDVDIP